MLDAQSGGKGATASARRLREALAGLQGCFYGLSRGERRVIILRTGLGGRRSHSRTDVARRLGTSRGQIRRVERRAVRKLFELVRTDGCAAGGSGQGAGLFGSGLIGPAQLAQVPALIAFGNPAYQGVRQADLDQTDFSRLGASVDFPSSSSARRFADRSDNGILWAFQLLAVMLLVAIGGFTRAAPLVMARARSMLAALGRRSGHRPPRRGLETVANTQLARTKGKSAFATFDADVAWEHGRSEGPPEPVAEGDSEHDPEELHEARPRRSKVPV